MIIRDGELIFRTEEQQHAFNFPFQLGTQSGDRPADALSFSVSVSEGDIVILGTDGLYDNLFDEDILQVVKLECEGRNPVTIDPKRITDILLKKAREVAEDNRTAVSPFEQRAIQEGMYYRGGKMDDITVIAGVVS